MDDNVEMIRSNKGGMKLIHRGYMYTVHKRRQSGGIRWRCCQRSLHCKGSISTGNGAPKVNMPHNHIPDPHSVAIARCRQFEECADLIPLGEADCDDAEDLPFDVLQSNSYEGEIKPKVNHRDATMYGRCKFSNEFRRKVIVYAEKFGNSRAATFYGVNDNSVRRWRRHKVLIYLEANNERRNRRAKAKKRAPIKKPKPQNPESTQVSQSSPPAKVTVASEPPAGTPTRNEQETEEVCLRWNSHHNNMKNSFPSLLLREQYVDVTLASEGKTLKCHRLILSSCSPYFDEMFSGLSPMQHPVIFLNGIEFWILRSLIDFMYAGEVNIEQNRLPELLKVAELLQIKGLAGKSTQADDMKTEQQPGQMPVQTEIPTPAYEAVEQEAAPVEKKARTVEERSPKVAPLRAAMVTTVDPLALLQPAFIEEGGDVAKTAEDVGLRKGLPQKIRKRKNNIKKATAPVLFRKGTKSRPHVKVPRYYHNDYENLLTKSSLQEVSSSEESFDLGKVKWEPIDIDVANVQFCGAKPENADGRPKLEATDKSETAAAETKSEPDRGTGESDPERDRRRVSDEFACDVKLEDASDEENKDGLVASAGSLNGGGPVSVKEVAAGSCSLKVEGLI